MALIRCVDGRRDGGDHAGKPSLKVGQDLSDVVPAGAEHGEEGVADGAFQGGSVTGGRRFSYGRSQPQWRGGGGGLRSDASDLVAEPPSASPRS